VKPDITLGKCLGVGHRGKVMECWVNAAEGPRGPFALKEIDLAGLKEKARDKLLRELHLIRRVQTYGEFFVGLEDFWFEGTPDQVTGVSILMEYMGGGSLDSELMKRRNDGSPFAKSVVKRWLAQVAVALFCLHHNNICHRDLKPDNLFFADPACEDLRVGDFSVSKDLTEAFRHTCGTGTVHYQSPEKLTGRYYGLEDDIWAFGVIAFEALCLKVPFPGTNPVKVADQILNAEIPEIPDWAVRNDNDLRDLIMVTIDRERENRATAAQLCLHPALRSSVVELVANMPEVRSLIGGLEVVKNPEPVGMEEFAMLQGVWVASNGVKVVVTGTAVQYSGKPSRHSLELPRAPEFVAHFSMWDLHRDHCSARILVWHRDSDTVVWTREDEEEAAAENEEAGDVVGVATPKAERIAPKASAYASTGALVGALELLEWDEMGAGFNSNMLDPVMLGLQGKWTNSLNMPVLVVGTAVAINDVFIANLVEGEDGVISFGRWRLVAQAENEVTWSGGGRSQVVWTC